MNESIEIIRKDIKNKDVIICSLKESFDIHSQIYEEFFKDNTEVKTAIFKIDKDYLNLGIFIYIPKNTIIGEAIINTFQQYPTEITDALIVLIEENSKVLINELLKDKQTIRRKNISKFYLKKNAVLKYKYYQNISDVGLLEEDKKVFLGDGASLKVLNSSYGGKENNYKFLSKVGKDCMSNINWIFEAKQAKHNISAINDFTDQRSKGDINIHGVTHEKSDIRIDGIIKIRTTAKHTESSLIEKILMLDKDAKIDATPILEIDTNDVQANHSVSITKLFAENIFYALSKGITKIDAIKMMSEGFLQEVERIYNQAL